MLKNDVIVNASLIFLCKSKEVMVIKPAVIILILCTLIYFQTTSAFACTLVGATGGSTIDGNTLIASTSDNPYIPGPRKPVMLTIPKDGGYKFVHTPCIIQEPEGDFFDVGSDRGMNETGFCWTRSWVVPNEAENIEKTNAVDWFLKMGATVSTVEEAIVFVKENPKGFGCQGNYIFGDAKGNLAVVEVGFETVTVVEKWSKSDNGLVARANRWESEAMKPLDISAENNATYYNTSEYRYNRAMELLTEASGNITAEKMKSIISDRNMSADPTMPHLNSINNHGTTDGTISAEIYDPTNLTFWYAYGWIDGDTKDSIPGTYGENTNSWGTWVPFVLSEMTEEGYYTTWEGEITPIGTRYLMKINARNNGLSQTVEKQAAMVEEFQQIPEAKNRISKLAVACAIISLVLATWVIVLLKQKRR
ncbi:MAG: carcinine hydrolase/isopenicillin-N N-acyltransferase family protein [Angelakisella sp.]|nr:carcinine hydrolase/isopenicillin-N N-acyltransferase family protein [Angelakisella sp.]